MAYKFQIGAAKLSGSVQLTDGSLDSTDVNDATAANIVSQIDAGEIPIAKLAANQISGKDLGSNLDDLTVDNSSLELNSGTTFNGSAGRTINVKALGITNAMLAGSIANAKLVNSTISGKALGSNLDALAVDDSSIEYSAGSDFNGSAASTIRVKASGITNDMLAGSIANGKLSNSAVTVASGDGLKNGGSVSLGGTLTLAVDVSDFAGAGLSDDGSENLAIDAAQTTISSILHDSLKIGRADGQDHIDFSVDDQIQFDIDNTAIMDVSAQGLNVSSGGVQLPAGSALDVASAGTLSIGATVGANNLTLGAASSTVVIPGNLTVSGTTVEIDAAFVVTSSVQFEGLTPDGNEISLTSADPTADRSIVLPDLSGHIPLLAGAVSNANVTANEFALLDGDSSPGTTAFADGHGLMHNAAGNMRQTTALKFAEYLLPKITGGDVVVSSGGVATIQAGAVESGMLNPNVISGQTELAHADIADADEFLINDNGALKRVGVDSLRDHYYGSVSGDAQIADGGALTIQSAAVEGSMLNNNVISGQTQLSVSSASDIAGSDELMISDAGVLKRVAMSGLKTFIGNGTAAISTFGDADATLAVGVNVATANTSAARTLTLPASAGLSVGESVKVKVAGVSSGAITISRAGSQTIDGNLTSIILESDNAAIEFVYVANDDFRIF